MAPAPAKRPAPVDEDDRKNEAAKRAAEIAARVGQKSNPSAPASSGALDPNSTQAKLAAIKAKIEAKAAKSSQSSTATSSAQPTTKAGLSLEAIKARTAASLHKAGVSTPSPQTAIPPAPKGLSRLDEIKARVAASKSKSADETEASFSPPRARLSTPDDAPPQRPPALKPGIGYQGPPLASGPKEPVQEAGRGGLATALHPSLIARDLKAKQAQAKPGQKGKGKQAQQPAQEEEADEEGSQEQTPTLGFKDGQNPYMIDWSSYPGWKPRKLRGKLAITHSMHQRPIMERENKRREAEALKALNKQLEEQSAVETEEEVRMRAYAVQAPPAVEWWDEPFANQDVDTNPNITDLVTQPILIEGPQKKLERKPFVLPLTQKEYKKKRRMRRAAAHQELTQKIRLGLEPTPAPKLTKQNFMRVMPEEAIKNPTLVEHLVNQQIEERQTKHVESNESRKLSKEERLEKTKAQAERNAKMGLKQLVFSIALGTDRPYQLLTKHKYLLQQNATQWHDLTGVGIVMPRFTLLFVEGGELSTRHYKHLVVNRIKFMKILSEARDRDPSLNPSEVDKLNLDKPSETVEKDPTARLVFEGEIRKRAFKKWGGLRNFTSEAHARTQLEKFGCASFLSQAIPDVEALLAERELQDRRFTGFFLTRFIGAEKQKAAQPQLERLGTLLNEDARMLERDINGDRNGGEDEGDAMED